MPNLNERTQGERSRSRRSFLALTLDFAFYGFGMSFVSMVTILPAFVSRLSESSVLVGLITSIAVLGFSGPQILVTNRIEKLRTRKPFIMTYTLGERIPWLALAALTVLLADGSSSALLMVFFVSYAVANVSAGVTAPAWFDLVARVVPNGRRGLYFGASNFLSAVLGVVGGFVAGRLIDMFEFPLGYAACFLFAFLLTMISYVMLWTVKEPESYPVEEGGDLRQYLSSLPSILREDKPFSMYLLATVIGGIATMAPAFLMAYALRMSGASEADIGAYTSIYFASQVLSNFLWIYLGDSIGHMIVVTIGSGLGALAGVIAVLSTSFPGFAVVFALIGAAASAFMVSWFAAVMDFGSEQRRPTYLALASALRAPPAALAPILGGVIADTLGYVWIFGIASFASLASAFAVFSAYASSRKVRVAAREALGLVRQRSVLLSGPRRSR